MERRFTAFVLPLLLVSFLVVLILGPEEEARDPDANQERTTALAPAPMAEGALQSGGDEYTVERTFGAIGEPGSFHVEFDRRGASVRTIRLLDEPASVEDYDVETRTLEGCYAVVRPVQLGITSLALSEARREGGKFGVRLGDDPWEVEEIADGLRFSLRDEREGLTILREYRHEPGSRELILTVSLVADATRPTETKLPEGADSSLTLYGLSLVNPHYDFVLGQNPAIAIGQDIDRNGVQSEPSHVGPDGKPGSAELIVQRDAGLSIDYAGTTNRFFCAFLRPSNDAGSEALWRAEMSKWPKAGAPLVGGDDSARDQQAYSVPVADYRLRAKIPAAGQRTDLEYRVYIGPKSTGVFDENSDYQRFDGVMEVALTPPCFCTIPGATFMAKMLLGALRGLEAVVGSWGFAIVLLTLIVRGLLVPLNFRMQKAMRAYGAKAAKLKPQLDAIKERNADDPKRMQQEMMAFQREHKLMPPLGGCLPLLITIPIFLGLFTALRVAYELRCEPFIGWISDLSQADRLFALPFWPHDFNLLPLIMVVLWLVLQMGTPLPKDPQQRQVMKIMRFMPIMFGIMLYDYAAGLMVYMITSSSLGILEQRITKKILGPPPDMGTATPMPAF